jgi:hypothetical protein
MRLLRLCLVLALTFVATACDAQSQGADVDKFWSAFRQAVLANDKNKIAGYTRFPFEVRGGSDSDPVQRLKRDGFLAAYDKLVTQPVYVPVATGIVERTMKQLIEEQTALLPEHQTSASTLRFRQFEFERVKGRWMFTRAYLEE